MTRPFVWPVPALALALALTTFSQPARAQSADPSSAEPNSDESQDSGLGLEWVWANAEIGASYVNMESFSSSNLALEKTASSGPAYGFGAGVRLLFLTLGAHVRDLSLSSIGDLWLLNLEAALHTRIWRLDPYLGVRGGYNFVGSLSGSSVQVAAGGSPSDVSVHGFNVGPIAGMDVYLVRFVSIGADFDGQFLFLQRPVPPLPNGAAQILTPQQQTLYKESGSSVGFGFTAAAHVGLHF